MASTSTFEIDNNGDQIWRRRGRLHRKDGPALIFKTGSQFWCFHGNQHRVDGPAVIQFDGSVEWWLSGVRHKFDEWLERTPLDEHQKLLLKLQYG